MKITQKMSNPFALSDTNKRYYTYDYYLRKTFGGKCAKIPLDIGCTCPNIDGRCGVGGCIYCSSRGSGDFAPLPTLSIAEQYNAGVERLSKKWDVQKNIAYFQAHTNTYAPVAFLAEKFNEALEMPHVVGLNIATRADCLFPDCLDLLASLAERTVLCVELGLQSSNDKTAQIINRGHDYECFCKGFSALRNTSPKINICVHIINGLPCEGREDMINTVRDVSRLMPDQVKLHLLHVLSGTPLADMYNEGKYHSMEREEYIATVAEQLTLLPENTVICRLTGDGAADSLLAPAWSVKKTAVINDIDKLMFEKNLWQGKNFSL